MLTQKETKMMQALSVMAMLCLHLFDRLDFAGLYTPLIYLFGRPLCFYFAQISDFCVAGFAFCSGYGHMVAMQNGNYSYSRRLKKLLCLYIDYWVIMALFSVVSICIGQGNRMPGSAMTIVKNVLTLDTSWNGACWYLFTYALIVLLSPVLLRVCRRTNSILLLGISFALYFAGFVFRFKMESGNWFAQQAGRFLMTWFEYLLGVMAVKHDVFAKLHAVRTKMPKYAFTISAAAVLLGIFFGHTLVIGSVFVAPFTGAVILVLFAEWQKPEWVSKTLLFIGRHATNIWLTHMFFYAVLFSGFAYTAKYPPLILALLLATTVCVSLVLHKICDPLEKRILIR